MSAKDINKDTYKGSNSKSGSKFDIRQLNILENLEFAEQTVNKKGEKVDKESKPKKASQNTTGFSFKHKVEKIKKSPTPKEPE